MKRTKWYLFSIMLLALISAFGIQAFASEEYTLVLGENTVVTEEGGYSGTYTFVAQESGDYLFTSQGDGDPYVYIVDENGEEFDYYDNEDGFNFKFNLKANAGEAYNFSFGEWESATEYSVYIEKHVHSSSVETCLGYLCGECGNYFGEAGDHRPGEETCLGYMCIDCYEYFGEAGDHRLDEQTCIGYRCMDCYEYFGEGNGIHSDKNDAYNNICDHCLTYFGPTDFTTGEQTVRYEDYYGSYLIRFIPEETGVYIMSSHATEESGIDPKMYAYSVGEDGRPTDLTGGYDENGKNFLVEMELVAGETYYFAFYSENQYEEYPINFYLDTHVHSGGTQNCKGYLCDCGEYYGEAGDHTPEGDMTCLGTMCAVCDEYFGDSIPHNKVGDITCSGYFCDSCERYQGVGDPSKHKWGEGNGECSICEEVCQHSELDAEGECLECAYQLDYSVTTGDIVEFYTSLNSALENAEDGSVIKVLRDTYESAIDFEKSVTLDLAGHTIDRPSSGSFGISAEVRFMDSVGGGFLNIPLQLYSRVVFESGAYYIIDIVFDTDESIADYLLDCHKMVDIFEGQDLEISDAKEVLHARIVISHEGGEKTCVGHFCDGCGESLGEADPDAHKFSEPTCTDPATCSLCFEEEGEALGHDWLDATYENPKTCSNCGSTDGEPLEKPDTSEESDANNEGGESDEGGNLFSRIIQAIVGFFTGIYQAIVGFFNKYIIALAFYP